MLKLDTNLYFIFAFEIDNQALDPERLKLVPSLDEYTIKHDLDDPKPPPAKDVSQADSKEEVK